MKRNSIQMVLPAALIVALASNGLCASLIDIGIVDHTGPSRVLYRAQAAVTDHRVRIHVPAPAGHPDEFLFVPARERIYYLDHAARRFMEFDTRVLGGATDMARSVRDFFRDRLADMRKEPRGERNPLVVQRTDETGTLSGLPCRKYIVLRGGSRFQEIWAASWSDAGLNRHESGLLKTFGGHYEGLVAALSALPMFAGGVHVPLSAALEVNACPVLIRQYENDRLIVAISLGKPRAADIDPKSLDVPAGFTRRLL